MLSYISYLQSFPKFVFLSPPDTEIQQKEPRGPICNIFSEQAHKRLKSIKPDELKYQRIAFNWRALSSSDIRFFLFLFFWGGGLYVNLQRFYTQKFIHEIILGSVPLANLTIGIFWFHVSRKPTFNLFNYFIFETKSIFYRLQNFKLN